MLFLSDSEREYSSKIRRIASPTKNNCNLYLEISIFLIIFLYNPNLLDRHLQLSILPNTNYAIAVTIIVRETKVTTFLKAKL